MALVLKDRVKVTSTTTGTGTFTLGSAALGYDDFSVIGDGNTTYYTISIAADWEVGIGTYTASGTTLSRDTVLASSNSGSLVNFGAGTKDVFCTYPAERSVNTADVSSANTANTIVERDGSGNFSAGTITAGLTGNASTATTLQTARTINSVSFDGSANIVVEPYVEDDEATAATRFLTFVDDSTAGYKRLNEDSSLTYNPSTNTLSAGTFSGSGASLTSLNASNLSTGTVPDARITGSYTGLTNLTGSGTVDFSNFLGNAADTATAPSFSWTGDTNTGIYQPAADTLGITTGGTERMRLTSAGGVSFGSSGTAYGTQDQVLVSNGNAVPSWNTLDLGYMPSAAFKKSVRVATTANITLSNVTTVVDGVTLVNGDRILVKNQTTDSQNGIYIVSTSGAWTRSTDANTSDKIAAAIVVVDLGTQGGLTYTNTFKASDTLGTTAMYWLIVSSTGYYRTNSTIAGGNDTTIRSVLGVAVTLAAGTVYDIEGAFYLNKTAGTTSSFINFSLQAAGGLTANNLQVHVLTRFGAGVVAVESVDNYGLITALNTNLACYAASTTAVVGLIVQYKGTISVNATGTLAPSYSQSAASGGAWTANIGNYMKIVPLGSAGVIDIGPWA